MKSQLLISKTSKPIMEIQTDSFSIKESALELLVVKRLNHTGQFNIIKYDSFYMILSLRIIENDLFLTLFLVGHGNCSSHLTNGTVELL